MARVARGRERARRARRRSLRAWCESGAGRPAAPPATEIDDLNVYPVPDGDTGTNLVLTMEAVADALRAAAAEGVDRLGATAAGDGPRGADGGPGQLRGHPQPAAARGRRACCAAGRSAPAATCSGRCVGPRSWAGPRWRPRSRGRCSRVARAAADAAEQADPPSLLGSGRRRRRAGPRGRWRRPLASWPCCAAPAWSTPAAAGWWSCSTALAALVSGRAPARPAARSSPARRGSRTAARGPPAASGPPTR